MNDLCLQKQEVRGRTVIRSGAAKDRSQAIEWKVL